MMLAGLLQAGVLLLCRVFGCVGFFEFINVCDWPDGKHLWRE